MKKTSVSSFYKENNFKPCLTKQLLNMFKLWCERGIRFPYLILNLRESTTLGSGKTKAKFIRKHKSVGCKGSNLLKPFKTGKTVYELACVM